jgi:hypothetical protein
MYNNQCQVTCIDNWSQFGGPRDQFFHNVNQCLTSAIKFDFVENDFRKINYSQLPKANIYMFDGPHDERDQFDGITMVQDALQDEYVLIVDDYNLSRVRWATQSALSAANCTLVASIEIITRKDEQHVLVSHQYSDWHNGYFIGVVRKS